MTANRNGPSPVAAVLFDLDGTLIDTAEDFVQVLNALLNDEGLPPLPALSIRNTVSDGARALIHLAFGGHEGEPAFEQKRQALLNRYLMEVGSHACLFPGMAAVLDALEEAGIPWGIVTNKPRLYTERLLSRLDLTDSCAVLVCPDDIDQPKPNPEGLLRAANSLGVFAEHCVYVGDHVRDIQAGKAAGMRTLAARFGYINDPGQIPSWQPHHIIDEASELLDWLSLSA